MPLSQSAVLHVLAEEIRKHHVWFNQQLGDIPLPVVGPEQALKALLPDLGLSERALASAWEVYAIQALHSNELDVKGNEELFLHFLLGLRKTWRAPRTLDSLAATLAFEEGTKRAKLLLERAQLVS